MIVIDFVYNDVTYQSESISTPNELYIPFESAESAAEAYTSLRSVQSYTFAGKLYVSRVVSKIVLTETKETGIRLYIKLRDMLGEERATQELEEARAELASLRELVVPVINSTSTLTAVKDLRAKYPDLVSNKAEEEK